MKKVKLSVAMLDNHVESAVINVGKNSGYVEAFIDDGKLMLCVVDKEGEVILERAVPISTLEARGGWTAPKFESQGE